MKAKSKPAPGKSSGAVIRLSDLKANALKARSARWVRYLKERYDRNDALYQARLNQVRRAEAGKRFFNPYLKMRYPLYLEDLKPAQAYLITVQTPVGCKPKIVVGEMLCDMWADMRLHGSKRIPDKTERRMVDDRLRENRWARLSLPSGLQTDIRLMYFDSDQELLEANERLGW